MSRIEYPITIRGTSDAPVVIPGPRVALTGPSGSGKSRTLLALCGALYDGPPDGGRWPTSLVAETQPIAVTVGPDERPIYVRSVRGRQSGRVDAEPGVALIASPMMLLLALDAKPGTVAAGQLAADVAAILPGPSVWDVMSRSLRDGEPRNEKAAVECRRLARREADQAQGAAEAERAAAARARSEADAVQPVPAEEFEAARRTLDQHAEAERWRAQAAALRAWQDRRDAIVRPDVDRPDAEPVEPGPGPEALAAHHAASNRRVAGQRLEEVRRDHAQAIRDRDAARWRREGLRPPPEPVEPPEIPAPVYPPEPEAPRCVDVPGCQMSVWYGRALGQRDNAVSEIDARHAEQVEGRLLQIRQARALYEDQRDRYEAEIAGADDRIAEIEARISDLAEQGQALSAEVERLADLANAADERAEAAQEASRRQYRETLAAWQAWQRYDAEVRGLGAAPPAPEGPEPVVDGDPAEARATVERAQRAARDAEGAARRAAEAEARAAEAEAKAETARGYAARADEVLEIVRAAPSIALQEGLAPLVAALEGSPVALHVVDGGLSATYRGRAWECASTGERVHGAALIRAALRSQVPALAWVPILVDGAQDWSGDLAAEVSGPLVLTYTGGESLTVEEVTRG